MTTQEIFDLGVRMGIKADLRGEKVVMKRLARVKKKYEELSEKKKKFIEKDVLTNPYGDTRIHYVADPKREIKKIMVGVDIAGPEIMLAKELGDIDLVISHHPVGRALNNLSQTMEMQSEILAQYGVPINVAHGLLKLRISEVSRSVNPSNGYRPVDFAQLLGIDFIGVHTPCDNLVARFLYDMFNDNTDIEYVEDVMELLDAIPEYEQAKFLGFGPTLFAGSRDNFCGKIAITEITGGTEGSPDIYKHMSVAGVGTVIGMHMSEKHKESADKAHINAVIAGHMSSDSIGINLYLDELEKKGIEIVPISGLIRVSRVS